jgi:hypothetical protein
MGRGFWDRSGSGGDIILRLVDEARRIAVNIARLLDLLGKVERH